MVILPLVMALAAPEPFTCTVEGAKLLVPAMRDQAICGRIAQLVRPRPVRIAIRFSKPGIATAQVTYWKQGKPVTLPAISIATSDRAMGPATVDALAREVATQLG